MLLSLLFTTSSVRAQISNNGTPAGVPPSFDCAVRKLALDYGKKLLPERGEFKSLFDALQLQNCPGIPIPTTMDAWMPPTYSQPAGKSFYVDYAKGSDSNIGSKDSPVKTIAKGVALAGAGEGGGTVLLRAGTHVVSKRVMLSESESDITIQNFNGEHAIVTGGVDFKIPKDAWQQHNISKTMDPLRGYNNVYGRAHSMNDTDTIKYLGKVDSLESCYNTARAEEEKPNSRGPFTSVTYHQANFSSKEFQQQCFGVSYIMESNITTKKIIKW